LKNQQVYLLMLLSWLFGLCCAYEWGFITAGVIGGAIGQALDLSPEPRPTQHATRIKS
jgi:hypothetical protein